MEIDSSAPGPEGGLEFRMDVGRMSHHKVEDEVASWIRWQRFVGHKWGRDRSEYSLGRDVWHM